MKIKRTKNWIVALLTVVSLLAIGSDLMAQSTDEGGVKVKINATIDGEEQTFERTYETFEEMEADEELRAFREKAAVNRIIEINADVDHDFEWVWEEGDERIMILKEREMKAVEEAMRKVEELRGDLPHVEHLDGNIHIVYPDGESEIMVAPDMEELQEEMQVLTEKLRLKLDDEELIEELKELEIEVERLHGEKGGFYFFNTSDGEGSEIIILKEVKVTISELAKDDEVANKLGLDEAKSLSMAQFKTYPNPNEGDFTLEFQTRNTKEPVEVRILDITGREVFYDVWNNPSSLYKQEINLRAQGKGLYILQVRQGEETVNRKLMIE